MRKKVLAGIAVSSLTMLCSGQMAMAAPVAPASAASAPDSMAHQDPDITGVWERDPFPFGDDDETKLAPPPGGAPDLREPYASQWKALQEKRQAMLKAGTPLVDASTNCLPEGTPGIMEAIYPIQILQTKGQITILAELFMQTRKIYLDAPFPAADDLPPSYYGFSTATWEGSTLTVRTRGVQESVKFYDIPHGDALAVTEKITLIGKDRLRVDVSMDDPEYLNKPYTFTWEYKRNPTYRIPEYVCDHRLDVINPDGTVSFGGAS